MPIILTYIIITIVASLLAWSIFDKNIGNLAHFRIARKMMRMEFTSDIANTTVLLNRLDSGVKTLKNGNAIQESVIGRALLNSNTYRGEELILYIEKRLYFDAKKRNSTYRFYAEKEVYERFIDPLYQYEMTRWLKEILHLFPDHIDIQVRLYMNHPVLIIEELIRDNKKYDFHTYLEVVKRLKLPGNISFQSDGKLHITYSKTGLRNYTIY